MKQTLKSKLSREKILAAGLALFSSQGYRGSSVKEIADRAGISTGRLYHHFENKLQLFSVLLDQYWERLLNPESELNQLIARAAFPDDIPQLARAIGKVVADNTAFIKLIYVDMIEFKGEHINRFYRNMAANFRKAYRKRFQELRDAGRFDQGADPYFAVMMTFRFFFQYYLVESSFGVANHFGFTSEEVIKKAEATILYGILNDSLKQGAG